MALLDFCSPSKLLAILLYMVTGPSLILLNKYMISNLEFTYPTALASTGVLFSAIIVHAGHRYRPDLFSVREEVKQLVTWKFYCRKIAVLGLLQAVTLHWGNDVYEYLSVSLIQMLKAFAPVLLMLLMFVTGLAKVEWKLVVSILLLSCGTAVTSTGVSNKDNSFLGMLMLFGSEFSEAMKLVITQKLLQGDHTPADDKKQGSAGAPPMTSSAKNDLENAYDLESERQLLASTLDDADSSTSDVVYKKDLDVPGAGRMMTERSGTGAQHVQKAIKFTVFETLYYYAPITFFFMMCLSVATEARLFIERYDYTMTLIVNQWYLFVIGGMFGFGVNIATFGVTGLISGLYLKALATFRNICLIGVAVVLFNESVTPQEVLGFTITLVGFCYYNYIKIMQSEVKK